MTDRAQLRTAQVSASHSKPIHQTTPLKCILIKLPSPLAAVQKDRITLPLQIGNRMDTSL